MHFVAGNPPTQKDCWFIGDEFLTSAYKGFMAMRVDANDGKIPQPYTYDYYNVHFYHGHPLDLKSNALANIRNAVIEGLNENKHKLPRFLVIIPKDDILKCVNYFSYGISMITGRCLNWLITEIDKIIDGRKDQLRKRKPGLVGHNEPKVLWVKMMNRPNIGYDDLLACRGKFNTILKDLLTSRHHHYIMDVSKEVVHPLNFIANNKINARGLDDFWNALDQQIKRFDYNKGNFDPLPVNLPSMNHAAIPLHHISNHKRTQNGQPAP